MELLEYNPLEFQNTQADKIKIGSGNKMVKKNRKTWIFESKNMLLGIEEMTNFVRCSSIFEICVEVTT